MSAPWPPPDIERLAERKAAAAACQFGIADAARELFETFSRECGGAEPLTGQALPLTFEAAPPLVKWAWFQVARKVLEWEGRA